MYCSGIVPFVTLLALICAGVFAEEGSLSRSHIHKEKLIQRHDFVRRERANPTEAHEVVISVKQKNQKALKEELHARSSPGHPKYQQWMNYEEIVAMTRNDEASDAVMRWLDENDVEVTWMSRQREFIRASATIGAWEDLLQAQFYRFEDHFQDRKSSHMRSEEYSIPVELDAHIDAVFYTSQVVPAVVSNLEFLEKPSKSNHFDAMSNDDVTDNYVSPSVLKEIYGVPSDLKGEYTMEMISDCRNACATL
jgi:subtilase family serine protease